MAEKRQRSESVDELAHDYHATRPLVQRPRTTLRRSRLRHEDYTVAWICALYFEMASAITMLDEQHEELPTRDPNHYVLGRIGRHNVVIACLGAGRPGIPRATRVLTDLTATFGSVTRCLLVGVGGGFPKLPNQDIRLGDVVVGLQIKPYDSVRATAGGRFQRTGDNMRLSSGMSTALNSLQALHNLPVTATDIVNIVRTKFHGIPEYRHPGTDDVLFLHTYDHVGPPADCQNCVQEYVVTRPERLKQGPHIHYGAIASGSMVIKDGVLREKMYEELDVMCAETEAGGLEDIVPLVIRGISDYADSHQNDVFQKYASANAAAFAVEFLRCLKPIETPGPPEAQFDTSRGHEEEVKEVEKRRKMRLSSMRFDHMSSRQFGITGRLMSTCQWLLEHESYLAWRDDAQIADHLGFLWLKGKPGAGKSTLMRFAYEEHKKSEGRGRRRTPNTVMASFFFHARGEELQRSVTGMYRSLVYQLFRGFPELGELLDDWELLPPNEKDCPSLDQLRELFQRAISSLGNQQHFVCYVDALDECDEKDVVYMVRTFQDLAEEHNQRYPRFRVFFSSRHYPQVQSRIGLQLELDNQKGHTNDLQRYAESRLLYKDKGIKERLVGKARGVFMWIVLVVDILNKDSVGGMPISAASKKLEELPEDLSALFAQILKRHDSHMGEFIVAVVWILFATRSLTPEEFEHAIWSHSAVDGSGDPPRSDMSIAEETDRLRQRVTRFTKGLAEVITNEDSSVVQFIHESVRDFLLKDQGLAQVWSDAGPHISSQGHEMLKICCENYIKSAQIPQNFPRTQANRKELASLRKIYPLLEYSAQNILYHANNAEPVVSQTQFLLNLSIQSLNRCLSIFDKRGSEYYKPETDMLYLLADGGHARLINTWPHDLSMMCSSHGKYCSPLVVALAGKRTEAISALLKLPAALCLKSHLLNGPGDRAQLRSGKGQSLLSWASDGGHTELIRVLLDRGAGIDDLDPDGYTALARAVLKLSAYDYSTSTVKFLDHEFNARSPAISMLLRNGAQWDLHTAISMAERNGLSYGYSHSEEEERHSRHRFRWTLFEWGGREENLEDLLFMCRSGNCGKNKFLLHHAARSGRLEAVKLLTDNDTRINFRLKEAGPWSYDTPYEEAMFGKHRTVAEFLLQKGIDVCDEGDFHTFPFWSHVARDQLGMLQTLVEETSGVDWHLDFGTAPLALTSRRGSTKVAKWLIANGADIEGKDHRGRTPLLIASMEAQSAMVKVLLDYGANIESKDEKGRTPLLVASMWAQWDTIQVLLEYGADHRACTQDGWSSLMFACRYSPVCSGYAADKAIRQLLQEGADVNHRGKLGKTPLRLAVERGNVLLVKFLLSKGADIAAKDDEGRTVLEYLSQSPGQQIRHHSTIVQALQERHESLLKTGS